MDQWIRLCLPSSGSRFKSKAHHIHFFSFIVKFGFFQCAKIENKQKEVGFDSVGKVAASFARGLRFESSHRRNLKVNMFNVKS